MIADRKLGLTASGHGQLLGALGVGALLGALALSRLRSRFGGNSLLLVAAVGFGLSTTVLCAGGQLRRGTGRVGVRWHGLAAAPVDAQCVNAAQLPGWVRTVGCRCIN